MHCERARDRLRVLPSPCARKPAEDRACRNRHHRARCSAWLRLLPTMCLTNALDALRFGGGEAGILALEGPFDRRALFASFGYAVEPTQAPRWGRARPKPKMAV